MAGVTLVCGGIAGSLGLLTLIEDFSSFDLHINRHLTGAYVDSAAAYLSAYGSIDRPSGFLLAGVAFICSYRAERSWLEPPMMGLLGSIFIGIGRSRYWVTSSGSAAPMLGRIRRHGSSHGAWIYGAWRRHYRLSLGCWNHRRDEFPTLASAAYRGHQPHYYVYPLAGDSGVGRITN